MIETRETYTVAVTLQQLRELGVEPSLAKTSDIQLLTKIGYGGAIPAQQSPIRHGNLPGQFQASSVWCYRSSIGWVTVPRDRT